MSLSMAERDAAVRERIETSIDESLIVEAAAGTGKTTQLVARLVSVLASGTTTVDRVVAVTFTRKAAGEMKLRLRQELDRNRAASEPGSPRHRHLEAAIAQLEQAHIGTIHSFCAELLRERPVEAGIDPGFVEMDEEEAAGLYNRVFDRWVQDRLEEMPEALRRALSRLAVSSGPFGGTPLDAVRKSGRDLIDWRDFPAPWSRPEFDREPAIDALVEQVTALGGLVRQCGNPKDYLKRALIPVEELATWIERSEAATERNYDALEARFAVQLPRELRRNKGWKGRGKFFAEGVPRDWVLTGRERLLEALETFSEAADADLAALLREELDGVTRTYEREKRRLGRLDFLDLLLEARNLVAGHAAVRSAFQERFTHLFVDEFQDTDPLQAELLVLLSGDDPEVGDWRQVRPAAGKLFVVGDPKQSIYRFRRADVRFYQSVKEQLVAAGVPLLHLTRSFRSVRPIQQAVNAAFEPEMNGDPASGQPDYVPLDEFREAPRGQPSLVALPLPRPYGWRDVTNKAIDECLPETVGAFVAWLVDESGWTVEAPGSSGERVPLAPRHVCILFRRYLSWGRDVTADYVGALESRGVPHVLVGGRSLHQREEVETLRVALTAIEWPDDELSVFATLKRSLFGVPDDLLLRFRETVGRLHPLRPYAQDLDSALDPALDPVLSSLKLLGDLHRRRNRVPIAATVERLLRETRAHAGFALRPAGHQVVANVEQVAEFARRFELRGGLSFRSFVHWLEEESERFESRQAPVIEEGAEGVRIMTVHTAKGLEFPVVLLADITANVASYRPNRWMDAERGLFATKLLGCAPRELIDNADAEQLRDAAEGQRLAYVAATRARDLLVLPTVGDGPSGGWVSSLNRAFYPATDRYRDSAPAPGCPSFGTASILKRTEELDREGEISVRPGLVQAECGEQKVVWWDPALLDGRISGNFGLRQEEILAPDGEEKAAAARGLARYREWKDGHEAAVREGARIRRRVDAVGALEESPPGYTARIDQVQIPVAADRPSGARFGSLVHTTLRDVALDASQGEIDGLVALHGRVLESPAVEVEAAASAVAAVLAHPLLAAAAASDGIHREAPFVLRVADDRLVEGTLDLAFLEADGWTVIDFKTDLATRDDVIDYRRQLGWYLFALERLTGKPARGVLLGV